MNYNPFFVDIEAIQLNNARMEGLIMAMLAMGITELKIPRSLKEDIMLYGYTHWLDFDTYATKVRLKKKDETL